jgi:hypothetical protein
LRRVPSPLHGTSHRTRSNSSWEAQWSGPTVSQSTFKWHLGKCWASWLVTIRFAVHIRFIWWMRRLHLCTSRSFAITLLLNND